MFSIANNFNFIITNYNSLKTIQNLKNSNKELINQQSNCLN